MHFGIWLPVYGGWLGAWGFDTEPSASESLKLAILAERSGFDYVYASEKFLNCIHGPTHDVDDASTILAAIAGQTKALQLVGALKPGFRPPLVAAQMTATVDRLSSGRVGVNIACGWWEEEFRQAGVPWRGHDEKYGFASRYLNELESLWAGNINGGVTTRRRLANATRPPIWVSGHSNAALAFASQHADVLFLNGMPPDEIRVLIERYCKAHPARSVPTIAINAFIILGSTETEAHRRRAELLSRARTELIALYRRETAQKRGRSCRTKRLLTRMAALRLPLSGPTNTYASGWGSTRRRAWI
jgi:FMNH2-dependent dimethyl sulfone monooxygenase